MRRSAIEFVALFLICAMSAAPLSAQAPPSVNQPIEQVADQSTAHSASYTDLEARVRILESRIDTANKDFEYSAGVFVFLIAMLGIGPQVLHAYGQSKERKSHEQFLQGSADTIRLVNDTLRLAKDASERSATSAERRAKSELSELDSLSQSLIIRASQRDDRDIVADPSHRAELENLAERIYAFDSIYPVILDERVILTPNCLFIRGLHLHLKQHFDEAVRLWRRCALSDSADSSLRSRAWYWIGYESNNLGDFDQARRSFHEARKMADEERALELKRIAIETEFFFKSKFTTENTFKNIMLLLDEAEARQSEYGLTGYIDTIRLTAGNIAYVYANELLRDAGKRESHKKFNIAQTIFDRVAQQNKWSRLGSCQCAIQLGHDVTRAREEMSTQIRSAARDEFVNRVEPRSKVLARLTELICALAGSAGSTEVETLYGQVLSSLGDVDNRLTLYSLRQRRNVPKPEFRQDLDLVIQDAVGG
jgi:tetratricopeptide (TPR) repeat protein